MLSPPMDRTKELDAIWIQTMNPTPERYEELAAQYTVVPVYGEMLADMETPVTVLQRFASNKNVFLLESIEGGETWGRYSFIGVEPELMLDEDHSAGRTGKLDALRDVYRNTTVAPLPGMPRFCGGAVGFLGYEAACEFERLPQAKPAHSSLTAPRSRFLRADTVIVFDNVRHSLKIVVSTRPKAAETPSLAYREATDRIARIMKILQAPCPRPAKTVCKLADFTSNMTRDEYCRMVARTKEYIHAGDIIQAVLSRRFSTETDCAPLNVYRALRLLNPSPYMFFLKIGDHVLAGSSPEVMIRLAGNRVELRPIAGTRPRGNTEQEDARLADELLSDEKEKAEHVMLVDLGRNDLGRVSEPGSVQVRDCMVVERYSHVMHMVSHVEGILRREFDAYDVIRACFPAGTLSGAPKIRAMEIIHELEPEPRGAYGGAIGYIGYDGNMDLAITIRTVEMSGKRLAVQAGAGIVFDSVPQKEYEETQHKVRGMQKAVLMAGNNLELEAEGADSGSQNPPRKAGSE